MAQILDTTPAAARKLASRARAKLPAGAGTGADSTAADWAVVDAFLEAARAARSVFIGTRPGAAWIHEGEAKVAFDFAVCDGQVTGIEFRAEPSVLATVVRRVGPSERGPAV